jgi:sugar phosphate isomerase/epimerase
MNPSPGSKGRTLRYGVCNWIFGDEDLMNIEEADPALAILRAGARLFLFRAADSNRQSAGRGHTDCPGLFRSQRRIKYAGMSSASVQQPDQARLRQ